MLSDKAGEQKHGGMKLEKCIRAARVRKVFAGMTVAVHSRCKPERAELEAIVTDGGGSVAKINQKKLDSSVTIICPVEPGAGEPKLVPGDKPAAYADQGHAVYYPRFILNGALRQKLEPDHAEHDPFFGDKKNKTKRPAAVEASSSRRKRARNG